MSDETVEQTQLSVQLSKQACKLLDIASSILGSSVDELINSWVLEGARSLGISTEQPPSEPIPVRTRANMDRLLERISTGEAVTTAAMALGMSAGQARAWCLRYPSFVGRLNEAKIAGQLMKLRTYGTESQLK